MQKTVVCLKWGRDAYSPEWVNKLYRGVCRHLRPPFNFVCFTDETAGLDAAVDARDVHSLSFTPELKNIWWKLAIMHPKAGLDGTCLFLDLDTAITDSIDCFFEAPGRFYIIHNWIEWRKQIFRQRQLIGNSSVFRFEAGREAHAAEKFMQNPQHAINRDRKIFPSPQSILTHYVGLDNITWWDETWVRSYKRHCLPTFPRNLFAPPTLPPGVRILAFHGNPKPQEVINGIRRGPIRKRSKPMPQLAQHWY